MQAIPYMLAAIVVGALVSMQPPLNAILSRAVGSAYGATLVSVFVALCTILVISTFTGRGQITPAALVAVPWWVYLAGVVGALFVAAGVVIAPVTGALLFFVCILAGQLFGAMVMDHWGAFGLRIREISGLRVLGFGLVLSGAVMVLRG
jgi:transporter family-2 protein